MDTPPIVLVVNELPVDPVFVAIDNIIISSRLSLEIAKSLLEHVFNSWNKPDNLIGEKSIRKYLVVNFYQLLCEKQTIYLEGLQDFNNNADEHVLLQQKIKTISSLGLQLQKKEYHDEIIYYMNILS
jgi:hypothetical protein